MRRLIAGAVLFAAGIVALVEAHANRPGALLDGRKVVGAHVADIHKAFGGQHVLGILNLYSKDVGWSKAAYDLVHVGGVVLVVAGAMLLIAGLLARAGRAAPGNDVQRDAV